MRKWYGLVLLGVLGLGLYWWESSREVKNEPATTQVIEENLAQESLETQYSETLSITDLKAYQPSASVLTEVEQITRVGARKTIVTYESEGLTIRALLGVPSGKMPESGWPVIIFNHGYIPPAQYRTNEKYVAYFDDLVKAGYIVVKSDYRGHGESEGEAEGGYGSDAYTRDILNLVATMQADSRVDPNRIGMWGHSMGGHITLRNMVVEPGIKAGVIWAGVVASYPDLLNNWRRNTSPLPSPSYPGRRWRSVLQEQYGTPEENPEFWNGISATAYLEEISGPVQLHHGTADASVPIEFSRTLKRKLDEVEKPAELYEYPGDNHNLSENYGTAMARTIEFFNQHLKSE